MIATSAAKIPPMTTHWVLDVDGSRTMFGPRHRGEGFRVTVIDVSTAVERKSAGGAYGDSGKSDRRDVSSAFIWNPRTPASSSFVRVVLHFMRPLIRRTHRS
jgi:hypothetical protein